MTRPAATAASARPAHARSEDHSDGDGELMWRLVVRALSRYWPVMVVATLVAGIVLGLRLASHAWWPGATLAGALLVAGWWLPRPVNLARLAGRRLLRPDGGPRLAMWRLRRAAIAAGLLAPGGRLVALDWEGRPGFGYRLVLRCPRGSSPQRWAARAGQLAAALRREVTITDAGAGRIEITVVAPGAMARVPDQPHPLTDPPGSRR